GAASILDEVKQVVRERLLVGTSGRGARITDYAGEGTLLTWVRVVALRAAATIRRGAQRRSAREHEALLDTPLSIDDPDLSHLRPRVARGLQGPFEARGARPGPPRPDPPPPAPPRRPDHRRPGRPLPGEPGDRLPLALPRPRGGRPRHSQGARLPPPPLPRRAR